MVYRVDRQPDRDEHEKPRTEQKMFSCEPPHEAIARSYRDNRSYNTCKPNKNIKYMNDF